MSKRERPEITKPGHNAGRTPANKGRTLPPEPLTVDEVKALIRASSNRAPTGIRNRALIAVLNRAGLRLSEALALVPGDIDLDTGVIRVRHGKGDKARTVGVEPGAGALLERWMDKRKAIAIKGKRPVFCTLDGRPLHPSYVRTMLPRLAKRAGIAKRVHPHGLRHSRAFELMMDGVPVPVIQRMLGHTSLATTQRYLDHVAPADVIKAMTEGGWTV